MRWPWQKKPSELPPVGCAVGIHDRVLDEAGGMMADALICVTCGREKYPEVFGVALQKRKMPLNTDGVYACSGESSRARREAAWEMAS